jgi:nucleotide-binding universal stress UspA family protein
MFDKILVPVDFSEGARTALGHAALFAKLFGGSLELVHVVEEVGQANSAFWAAEPALAGQLQRRAVTSAEEAMERLLPTLPLAEGIRVETRILSGTVPGTLAEYAAESGASLMVVSTHGRTGLSRWLLGSVSERLLRAAPCPVLIARGGSAQGQPALQRVLVAVDLSEQSRRALHTAGEIARRSGAELEILYVWAAPFYDASEHFDAELFERIRQSARAELDEFVASAALPAGIAVQSSIESGTPSERIGQHLQARTPDLLVLGSHGHGGFRRLMLGSVAEVTVRYAPCAALVVPRPRNSEAPPG